MTMRRIAAVLVSIALLAGACSSGDDAVVADGSGSTTESPSTTSDDQPTTSVEPSSTDGSPTESTTGEPSSTEPRTTEASEAVPTPLAAALEQLVTEDHTFGAGPPPFSTYLIQSNLDPAAGSATGTGQGRPLTDDERSAIEAAISPLGPVQWIEDPDDWRTDQLTPTIEGSVILGVGEPSIEGERATIPVSLWCGGVCGTWFTYEAALVGGQWQITGIDGPIAIS